MKYAAEKNMKEDILPIFDIQVAQQNELIILNKKIADHKEAMSDLYEQLKNEPFLISYALSKELNGEEMKTVISKLNAKGEEKSEFLTNRLEDREELPQEDREGGLAQKEG